MTTNTWSVVGVVIFWCVVWLVGLRWIWRNCDIVSRDIVSPDIPVSEQPSQEAMQEIPIPDYEYGGCKMVGCKIIAPAGMTRDEAIKSVFIEMPTNPGP